MSNHFALVRREDACSCGEPVIRFEWVTSPIAAIRSYVPKTLLCSFCLAAYFNRRRFEAANAR